MAIKIITFLLVFTLALVCYATSSQCRKSPCFKYSMKECVAHLWDIPQLQNVTPTIREFREDVSCLVEDADDRLLGYLLSLSLWVVDHFTGMPTATHPSCIYGTLLNQSLVNNLINTLYAQEDLVRARSSYGGLCVSGIKNTVYVGMKMAGCEVKVPCQKCTAPCKIGSAPQMLLGDPTSEIPESMKPIMLKLATSTQIDEQAVAAAAFGASTTASIDFFQGALCEESFRKAVQLKGCEIKIPKKFCKEREEELKYWVKLLKSYTKGVLGVE